MSLGDVQSDHDKLKGGKTTKSTKASHGGQLEAPEDEEFWTDDEDGGYDDVSAGLKLPRAGIPPYRGGTAGSDTVAREFLNLPPKFLQILRQGGKAFQDYFAPMQLEISQSWGLSALLEYFIAATRLQVTLWRRNGLSPDPTECEDNLTKNIIRMLRQEAQSERHLTFPPAE